MSSKVFDITILFYMTSFFLFGFLQGFSYASSRGNFEPDRGRQGPPILLPIPPFNTTTPYEIAEQGLK